MIKTAMNLLWLCNCGYVIDMQQKHHGHKLYEFYMPEGKRVRFAYKKEIVRYIKKKDWEFMERTSKKEF